MSFTQWKKAVKTLKRETYTLYLISKHPQVKWWVKLLAILVVSYLINPIDLIPDFIPILGYLDDLILVPLGILLVIKLTPPAIIENCRKQATQEIDSPLSPWVTAIIIIIWLILGIFLVFWLKSRLSFFK